ncbi:conjugal transfer protein [Streptomyces sp. Isolate_45]|uniref:conjugal transfer protein n=1 Tax=Streptomyces sp. Isolate_45 TaxID=2950111 RepID=UPI002481B107|nr:conjugal transfer protein [Streptomyces sp. Isolate_45]MDA5282546.1 conjugal transfer protein [Streptomyces sp. Isolate_45]
MTTPPHDGREPVPALTEDMLIQQEGSSAGGWFRNPFAKKRPVRPAPPNPWTVAANSIPGDVPVVSGSGEREAPARRPPSAQLPEEPPAETTRRDGKKGKKGKEERRPVAAEGNGWFHNPFAKAKPSSGVDRGQVSTAQMWAGPRRGILVRRILGITGVLLLLFLFAKMGGKASKADVQALADQQASANKGDFPRGAALMWAAPLVKAFASYDPAQADARSTALKPYAINGLDERLGWNGQGKQVVIDMVMSTDVQVTAADRAVVRATVQVQDGSWRCLAVPLFAVQRNGSSAFGLTAAPVYVPCSGLTTPSKDVTSASNDAALAQTFKSDLLPPFMAAWIQSDNANLARYLLPGVTSFGLGGAYTGGGGGGRPVIGEVYVPAVAKGQDASRRTLTFSVTLKSSADTKAEQTSAYQVAIAQSNGQWYFASDPTPVLGGGSVGGDQLPNVQPTKGSGGLFSQSPTPSPGSSASGATPSSGPTGNGATPSSGPTGNGATPSSGPTGTGSGTGVQQPHASGSPKP